jgi:hypothetical protein
VLDGIRTQWVEQKSNGDLGTAIMVPNDKFAGYVEDDRNLLILAKVPAGGTVTYYAGAGWSKAGEFTSNDSWRSYVVDCAARARSPVRVTLTP